MINNSIFPEKLISPIAGFLKQTLHNLSRAKKEAKKADLITDSNRISANSIEDNVDEQLVHEDSVMRVGLLSKRIVQVRKALTRIKLGKYGICESCGKMIDTERLSVYPETTLCVSCQKDRE